MKIGDISEAADKAKDYQNINFFIRFINSQSPYSHFSVQFELFSCQKSVSICCTFDEVLAVLLPKREKLKKELTELGVEL
jgi:hypothetical protein